MTQETKKEIAELYADKNNKVVEIAEKFKISNTQVKAIAVEMGVDPRQKTHVFKNATVKKCPKCNSRIEIKGAKYCPFCAADIRSEKDILIEQINKLNSTLLLLPAGERDNARDIIMRIRAYLMKEYKQ